MNYKLVLPEDLSLEELKAEIDKGCRFIVFSYCIGLLFALLLKRLSPAIFIPHKEAVSKYAKKYNRISYILGWWQIPWGAYYTIKYIRFNNKGGLDVTEDIMLNIDEQSLLNREIQLEITNLLFDIPSNEDKKAFEKAFFKKVDATVYLEQCVVGMFMNDEEPFYVIGIKIKGDFQETVAIIKKALYTQFYKRIKFQFKELDYYEFKDQLLKQGTVFI